MKRTFKGGTHPHEGQNGKNITGAIAVAQAKPPEKVAIFLAQNIGVPCNPLVKAGERVLMYQKIGEPTGFIGAPIHASVSGKVLGIKPRINSQGQMAQAVIIENDMLDEPCPDVAPNNLESMDAKALADAIREAGIVGLGGAAFPTHVKLSPPPSVKVDTVILNGAECEPYLTSDHRTMLEHASEVVDGLMIVKRMLNAQHAYIGIEANKLDALNAISSAAEGKPIEVLKLPVKYPQGGEKQLIQVVTGRQVPSGKLPMDAGCVVINVSTATAISEAIRTGRPLIERTVTVTGQVSNARNLRVRIGETIGNLVDQCGGLGDGVDKVILGGPMMGVAAFSLETPIVKATSGILLLKDDSKMYRSTNCIRCASCAGVCPIRLMPMTLYSLQDHGRYEEAKANHAPDCIECGACSYVCPAKLPLAQSIRTAKREIVKMDRHKN